MDPLTHAALGAACAQAILYRYDKRNAWMVGALAALSPDLDIFIRSDHDPMFLYIYHRHFTHSLLFIPLGGFLIGLGLLLFKRFRLNKWTTFAAALLGYSTHCLLDAATTYGTQLFWPISDKRVSLDWIAIVDPYFTIPLILGLVWTWAFATRKGVLVGLLIAALYFCYCICQHERALQAAYDYGVQRYSMVNGLRALPGIGNSKRFRIIGYTANKLWVAKALVPWFAKNSIETLGLFSQVSSKDLPDFVASTGQQLRDFRVFAWFSEGYILTASKNPLILIDARFIREGKPLMALWGMQFIPGREHVKSVKNVHLEPEK
jgi:inner membrane protein